MATRRKCQKHLPHRRGRRYHAPMTTAPNAHCPRAFARCPSSLPGASPQRRAPRLIGSSTSRPASGSAPAGAAAGARVARWTEALARLGCARRAHCHPAAQRPGCWSASTRRRWRWLRASATARHRQPAEHRLHPARQRDRAAGRGVRHAMAGHCVRASCAAGLRSGGRAARDQRVHRGRRTAGAVIEPMAGTAG